MTLPLRPLHSGGNTERVPRDKAVQRKWLEAIASGNGPRKNRAPME